MNMLHFSLYLVDGLLVTRAVSVVMKCALACENELIDNNVLSNVNMVCAYMCIKCLLSQRLTDILVGR